jgi:hypothetical protein
MDGAVRLQLVPGSASSCGVLSKQHNNSRLCMHLPMHLSQVDILFFWPAATLDMLIPATYMRCVLCVLFFAVPRCCGRSCCAA